jgi:hypothetical protein
VNVLHQPNPNQLSQSNQSNQSNPSNQPNQLQKHALRITYMIHQFKDAFAHQIYHLTTVKVV